MACFDDAMDILGATAVDTLKSYFSGGQIAHEGAAVAVQVIEQVVKIEQKQQALLMWEATRKSMKLQALANKRKEKKDV